MLNLEKKKEFRIIEKEIKYKENKKQRKNKTSRKHSHLILKYVFPHSLLFLVSWCESLTIDLTFGNPSLISEWHQGIKETRRNKENQHI